MDSTLRVRHHAQHIALFVANTCNIFKRAIRVFAMVAEHDLVARFELCQRLFITVVVSFAMRDRNLNLFPCRVITGKRGLIIFYTQSRQLAAELE